MFISLWYFIPWLCLFIYLPNLFTHSVIDRLLGCFQFGVLINNATMDIVVRVFWCTCTHMSVSLEFLGHKVLLWIMPKFLSVWIPTSSVCVSVFAHLHQLNILSLFKFSHSGGCVTVSQCLFVIWIFSFMLWLFKSYFSIGLFLSCWFVVACYQMDLPPSVQLQLALN